MTSNRNRTQTCRYYSHTLVLLRHDRQLKLFSKLFSAIIYYKLILEILIYCIQVQLWLFLPNKQKIKSFFHLPTKRKNYIKIKEYFSEQLQKCALNSKPHRVVKSGYYLSTPQYPKILPLYLDLEAAINDRGKVSKNTVFIAKYTTVKIFCESLNLSEVQIFDIIFRFMVNFLRFHVNIFQSHYCSDGFMPGRGNLVLSHSVFYFSCVA